MSHGRAVRDFREARRRAGQERILARLRGRSANLVCYSDVQGLLVPGTIRERGVQDIPLEAVVGSMERCSDYTRGFLPLKDSDEHRWSRVKEVVSGPRRLPPIEVCRVGQLYLVVDGHHRVSVARQSGRTGITARVLEIQTRVPLTPDIQPGALAAQAEHVRFLERTGLDRTHPGADLSMSATTGFPLLDKQIQAHGQSMSLDLNQPGAMEEAASSWYDTAYLPTIQIIREKGMLQAFPRQTETDLYIWVCEHRGMVSDALGWEIDLELAAEDLVQQRRARPSRWVSRAMERILGVVRSQRA